MSLNEQDFRTLLDTTNGWVVAVFSAVWCGPCRVFAPIFEDTAKQMPDVKFAKLDVDECTQLCEDLNISIVPTIMAFKEAKSVARKEGGFATVSHFINWLDSQGIKGK